MVKDYISDYNIAMNVSEITDANYCFVKRISNLYNNLVIIGIIKHTGTVSITKDIRNKIDSFCYTADNTHIEYSIDKNKLAVIKIEI